MDEEVQERTIPQELRDHPAMKALRQKLKEERERLTGMPPDTVADR